MSSSQRTPAQASTQKQPQEEETDTIQVFKKLASTDRQVGRLRDGRCSRQGYQPRGIY
jgi:hypothetical protein